LPNRLHIFKSSKFALDRGVWLIYALGFAEIAEPALILVTPSTLSLLCSELAADLADF
jgi:hypothetical protein